MQGKRQSTTSIEGATWHRCKCMGGDFFYLCCFCRQYIYIYIYKYINMYTHTYIYNIAHMYTFKVSHSPQKSEMH